MSHPSRAQAIALPPTPSTPRAPVPDAQTPPVAHAEPEMARWWHGKGLRELYENNIGMLLIALAQLFFTFMNICVKILNDMEKPVPTLEVCVRFLECGARLRFFSSLCLFVW